MWLFGCARTEEYQLDQRIDMGPYSFAVVSADEGQWGSDPTINIFFRLNRDDTAPFTTDFSWSFADKMEIVDAVGNAFPVSPNPVSPVYRAGRQRSDRYLAKVRLSPSHEGVRDGRRHTDRQGRSGFQTAHRQSCPRGRSAPSRRDSASMRSTRI